MILNCKWQQVMGILRKECFIMMKHNVNLQDVVEAILDSNNVAAHDAAMVISRRDGGAAVDIIAQAKKEAFVVLNAG